VIRTSGLSRDITSVLPSREECEVDHAGIR
jgi:hypothetical protein